ncbi:6-galactanase [Phytophthora infestans]|uniref:6-galactanase n=1 Tax=Phytophthora infestans TaxID=4787 RepID=A0A833WNU9_PHYIN|nr:6-galactanase [Phytophthora infestans]KAF4139429.1 putative endo-beta-1/6-galactanase [Phytophthora infestans]
MLPIRVLVTLVLNYAVLISQPLQTNADCTVKADAAHGSNQLLGWLRNIALLMGTCLRRAGRHRRFTLHGKGRCRVERLDVHLPLRGTTSHVGIQQYGDVLVGLDEQGPDEHKLELEADAKQSAMVGLATKRDVTIVEAFSNSNSPPWWMTNNHTTAGGDEGGKDNLDDWNHDQFALYIAHRAFNEPMSTWWEFPGGQEGCHFEVDTQMDVLVKLRSHLDTLGLQDVGISSSDENSPSLALSTLTSMSSSTDAMAAIGKVNTHGYDGQSPYRGDDRAPLKTLVTQSKKNLGLRI